MAEVPYQNMENPSAAAKMAVHLDPESQVEIRGMTFSEQSIRRAFIRKVYLILTVSLVYSFLLKFQTLTIFFSLRYNWQLQWRSSVSSSTTNRPKPLP